MWHFLQWSQILPPGGVTCIATLPRIALSTLSVGICSYLYQSESHQFIINKGDRQTFGPIDQTPGIPGSDRYRGFEHPTTIIEDTPVFVWCSLITKKLPVPSWMHLGWSWMHLQFLENFFGIRHQTLLHSRLTLCCPFAGLDRWLVTFENWLLTCCPMCGCSWTAAACGSATVAPSRSPYPAQWAQCALCCVCNV